jgi:hypothetical protein
MVIVFNAQAAVTPFGKPVAVPMPVAPVVVCVMLGANAVLIQSIGVVDGAPAVLVAFTVTVMLQVEACEQLSVTVHVTLVVPAFRTFPSRVFEPVPPVAPEREYVILAIPSQISLALARSNSSPTTVYVVGEVVAHTVALDLQAMAGGVLSSVTVKVFVHVVNVGAQLLV